jgi:hypothetical protein
VKHIHRPTTIHWLVGLPGIGKTTECGELQYLHDFAYVQSDIFLSDAWSDANGFASDCASNKTTFVQAYINSLTQISTFVELHRAIGAHLVRRVSDHVAGLKKQGAFVEISSLYGAFISDVGTATWMGVDRYLHESRLARRFDATQADAQAICWTYTLAERHLAPDSEGLCRVDLSDAAEMLLNDLRGSISSIQI